MKILLYCLFLWKVNRIVSAIFVVFHSALVRNSRHLKTCVMDIVTVTLLRSDVLNYRRFLYWLKWSDNASRRNYIGYPMFSEVGSIKAIYQGSKVLLTVTIQSLIHPVFKCNALDIHYSSGDCFVFCIFSLFGGSKLLLKIRKRQLLPTDYFGTISPHFLTANFYPVLTIQLTIAHHSVFSAIDISNDNQKER